MTEVLEELLPERKHAIALEHLAETYRRAVAESHAALQAVMEAEERLSNAKRAFNRAEGELLEAARRPPA